MMNTASAAASVANVANKATNFANQVLKQNHIIQLFKFRDQLVYNDQF